MTPQKQAFRHRPEIAEYGDCCRTAFACLLDLPRDEVPHFGAGAPPAHVRSNAEREWLAARGLCEIRIAYQDEGDLGAILCSVASQNTGIHYMLTGKSASGFCHVVICLNNRIVWDTHPDDVGIVSGWDGHYFVSFLGKKL